MARSSSDRACWLCTTASDASSNFCPSVDPPGPHSMTKARAFRRRNSASRPLPWGYATLGQIGFAERSGYTAIGTVCNLAARLCAEAKDGQILVSSRIAGAVEAVARLEDLGNLELNGLRRPVAAFNVTELI